MANSQSKEKQSFGAAFFYTLLSIYAPNCIRLDFFIFIAIIHLYFFKTLAQFI